VEGTRSTLGDIRQGQRVEKRAFSRCRTVGDEISFHETGRGLIPIVEDANGNLLFEQRSRSGGRNPMTLALAVWLKNPISGRRTYREEQAPTFLAQMEMPMPLQRLH